MRYVSWAAFYEGPSDALYLDVLLPRAIRELIASEGSELAEIPDAPSVKLGLHGRDVNQVATEACEFKNAFDVVFIHADTGGRALESRLSDRADAYCMAMRALCDLPSDHCITLTPRHETEAWLLADGRAITDALGFSGDPAGIGLPTDARAAERLVDPKQVLADAIKTVAGRRRSQRVETLFPAIAQRQRMEHLRRSDSFLAFEEQLRRCLRVLGCVV